MSDNEGNSIVIFYLHSLQALRNISTNWEQCGITEETSTHARRPDAVDVDKGQTRKKPKHVYIGFLFCAIL
jgi:hypothetical protein